MKTAQEIMQEVKFEVLNKHYTPRERFSAEHVCYYCRMSRNGVIYCHSFQFNPVCYKSSCEKFDRERLKRDFITSVFNDADAYASCRDAKDFADNFGCDYFEEKDIQRVTRIYMQCFQAHSKLKQMFNQEEYEVILNYAREL